MIRSNGRNNAPYALLSAALLGLRVFFRRYALAGRKRADAAPESG